MNTKILNYRITWDQLENNILTVPESLKPQLKDLYTDLQSNKPGIIPRLQKLIKEYPSNLQLKNYLTTAYQAKGDSIKAMQVNDMILKEHPDYLFAKLNKASQFYEDGEYEKMPLLLGKGFELQTLYPDRDVFHISEFMGLQATAVQYYSATGDLDQALKRLDLMKDLDEDAPQSKMAEKIFQQNAFLKAKERHSQQKNLRITPQNQFHLKRKDFKHPEFHIEATAELYQYDTDIPDQLIQQFLDNDREKVIEDLENVLKDSYFNYDSSTSSKHDEYPYAPIHALFLLADLEAEKSLPVVLEMMQQGGDFFDEVFGDFITEAGWIPILKLGKNQLDLISEYLKLPGTYTYFRSSVSEALMQIWHYFPDKRAEVENIIADLMEFLTKARLEDNVIDTEFNGLLTWELMDAKFIQFLPEIKELYEKGYVSKFIAGTIEDVEEDMRNNKKSTFKKKEILNIRKIYDRFTDTTEKPLPINPNYTINQPIERTHKKIGRNDPCPCGSGKKYKKCCLFKN